MGQIEIVGEQVIDKHTHYEAYLFIGSERATIIIRGDIVRGFQEKYGIPITKTEKFNVDVDFGRNGQRVKECQNVYVSASHLIGAIGSLEDIIFKGD